ncbi:ATP-binding protein [Paludibacter sp. 221]|uniref:AAA family ATPase n=1 Tax=Paludibacter sp. 221 TaxID=2302939 RepID=UPI0013D192D0|nr:AAA family ATPase [Paludibacter sp. 221]NDV46879.1 ATP-binding protein [Paludibacter sp. 221]
MATIEIRNIGPIEDTGKFDLNTVNVFMGPQSSGKSTIAKIISFCTWVEKDVATNQSLKKYRDNETLLKDHIEVFHKIKGYFRADSFFSYKSDIVEIKWENEKGSLNWVDQYAYKRSKISYIPAERNMVILPEARKVTFEETNVRSFLFDWFDARKKYTQDEKLSILDLEVDYYYSEGNDEDHIVGTSKNVEYDILLSNASSGLQSITPLVLMIDYLTFWIYKEDKTSFEQEEKKRKVDYLLTIEKIIKPYFGKEPLNTTEANELLNKFNDKLKENDLKAHKLSKELNRLRDSLFTTKNVQYIIEEPEQNLFPETQRNLIYSLLEKGLNREGNRLTITTHSPYVLYALNNCMMGGLVNSQITNEDKKDEFLGNEFLSEKSWINPQSVSIWEIEDGKIRNIQDKDNIISENYFDKKMTELTDEYYQILNYYRDEE